MDQCLKFTTSVRGCGGGGQRVGGECQINSNQNILFTKYMNNIFLICLNEKKHKQERIHLSL
jgi:hypothetical protein